MNNYLPKVIVTGGAGQLATALKKLQPALSYYSRVELDITDNKVLKKIIEKEQPDIIINTAAYTAVDKAETEKDQAYQINYLGAKNLAEQSAANNITLIHVSTDYIFDGKKKQAYPENHAHNPLNYYGETKWLGEEVIREKCPQHIILRTSAVFSEYGHNFFKTILRLAKDKPYLNIVSDQMTCPTFATDIAKALLKIIQINNTFGTYHFCSKEPVSWYEFASAILKAAKYQAIARPIPSLEYPTPAKRPAYSVLACSKIERDFGISQPSWQSAIQEVLATGVLHEHVSTP